jgi:hypothetical protein
LYKDMPAAEKAYRDLEKEGFLRDQISVVAAEKTKNEASVDIGPIEGIGAEGRAGTGAAIGTAAGLLGGILALAIPGIGPAIAAGPFAVALGGAAVGAAAGTLIGVLKDRGVSEEEAAYFHEGILRGGVLISVDATGEAAHRAREILEKHDPIDVEEAAEGWRSSGWTGGRPAEAKPVGVIHEKRPDPDLPEFVKSEVNRKRERRTVRTYTNVV